jgi:phosphopantothenoylcysteine synthetase/decarboxylase
MIQRLLLGCTGSVGVLFIAPLIIKLRTEYGTEIDAIMTKSAQKFLTPYALEILTGNAVTTDMFDDFRHNHIKYVEDHSAFLIAPATANIISKIANGIADDIVSLSACVCMGSSTKLIIAPSMNIAMWDSPFVQENVERLKRNGVHFVGPSAGTEIVTLKKATTALASDQEIVDKLLEIL